MEGRRRQFLRPWLEETLNESRILGVEWLNKEEQLFKLPWKRNSDQTRPEDFQIFRAWAHHTGRMEEDDGSSAVYTKWKTRLRCAIHKAPDIKEEKSLHQVDPSVDEPYKAYRFLKVSNTHGCYSPKQSPSSSYDDSQDSPYPVRPCVNAEIPSVVNDFDQSPTAVYSIRVLQNEQGKFPSDLEMSGNDLVRVTKELSISDAINSKGEVEDISVPQKFPPSPMEQFVASVTCTTAVPITAMPAPLMTVMPPTAMPAQLMTVMPPTAMPAPLMTVMPPTAMPAPLMTVMPPTAMPAPLTTVMPPTAMPACPASLVIAMPSDVSMNSGLSATDFAEGASVTNGEHRLNLQIFYCGHCVRQEVTVPCRVSYKDPDLPMDLLAKIAGPQHVIKVEMPTWQAVPQTVDEKHIKALQALLGNMQHGFIVDYDDNGDIYVTRYCKATVFAEFTNSVQIKKLERGEKTKVFDQNDFENHLTEFFNGRTKKPSCDVLLVIGQKPVNDRSTYFIYVTVSSEKAVSQLVRLEQLQSPTVGLEMSLSDEYDNLSKHTAINNEEMESMETG